VVLLRLSEGAWALDSEPVGMIRTAALWGSSLQKKGQLQKARAPDGPEKKVVTGQRKSGTDVGFGGGIA